jgi:DNA-binding LytR/AlgR family response regulator
MNLRQCLIVEDSEPFRLLIESYLKRIPLIQSVKTCTNYFEAVDILSTEKIDLVFLDINLPEVSGLNLLRTFPNLPPTIIITSHSEYAVESYEIGRSVDYLLKPFDYERFVLAVNRALPISLSKNSYKDLNFIFVKMGRTLQRFNLDEIDYIEAYTIYSKIIYNGTPHVVNEIISSLNDQLDSQQFVRVHKSYIINIKKVTSIDSKYIWLDKNPIPMGKSYKPNFEGFLRLFDKNPIMD